MFPLHTRFLGFGCVVVVSGLVACNDTMLKCRILLITDQVLETEAHSSFLLIRDHVFWYPCRTHLAIPQMLMNNGVNRSFTQIEFATDFTGFD